MTSHLNDWSDIYIRLTNGVPEQLVYYLNHVKTFNCGVRE